MKARRAFRSRGLGVQVEEKTKWAGGSHETGSEICVLRPKLV